MISPVHIDEIGGDPRLDDYRGLRDPARRSRLEPKGGFFVAEGIFVIERLLASGLEVRSLLLTESKLGRLERSLREVDVPIYVVDRAQMKGVVGFDLHRGALAAANRPAEPSWSTLGGLRLVCALEGLNDHENLGAIIRSALALGVDAMVLDSTCADPWYRRSVRVSMGTVFDIPIVRGRPWPGVLTELRGLGYRIAALTVGRDAAPIATIPPGTPTVVVLGAEGGGLTDAAVRCCDVEVTIPIAPEVDSLNVGHAGAIAFHHFGSIG